MTPATATDQLESFSPFDGSRLGAVPTITPDQVQGVVDDVARVQPFWADLPLAERARDHAPHRPGGHRPAGRADRAAQPRAGQAPQRVVHDGAVPHDRRAALDRGRGPEAAARRAHLDAAVRQAEAGPLHLRAAGRGRRDRALELPVDDPVQRGGDRADVRQRRGAQAGVADAADRRADPAGVRARRRARGPDPHRARRRRRGRRAGGVQREEDLLHRLGRGRPRRRAWRAPSA